MGYWFDEKDDIKTILNHLGDKVPHSMTNDAKEELSKRGWSKRDIEREEWKRTK